MLINKQNDNYIEIVVTEEDVLDFRSRFLFAILVVYIRIVPERLREQKRPC